jgi:hypothetical protein
MQNVIAFNTGRGYTDKGQRIAAKRIGDRVIFVDIDRGLDYVTSAPCELTQRAIMRAYDYNETDSIYSVIPDYSLRQSVIDELETMARELTK